MPEKMELDTNAIFLRIKKARKEKKLSQRDLAEMMQTDQKTYSNWERQRTTLTLKNLNKICTALDLDAIEIVTGKEDFKPKPSNIENLIDARIKKFFYTLFQES